MYGVCLQSVHKTVVAYLWNLNLSFPLGVKVSGMMKKRNSKGRGVNLQ